MEDKKYSNKELDNYQDLLNREKDWKNRLLLSYKHQFGFQEELAELAFNFIERNKEKSFKPDSSFKEVAIFFLVKALKTFRSIKALTENGFGEDAAVLLRCQLELLIDFFYMAKEDQNERAEKYIYYCYILEEKLLKELSHSNLFYEVYEKIPKERIKEKKEKYEEHKKLYPNKRWWSNKSIEEMANDVGLKDYYILYRLYSNFVHSNVKSSHSYISINNNVIIYKIGITSSLIKEVLVANVDFLLRILNQLNDIFHLGQDDCLQEALNRFYEAFPKELSKDHV